MKFVYNKSHLQAGLDTRYSDDGEQIFGNDQVITSLHYLNDDDAVFSKAAANIDLPCYYLALKHENFSLHEAMCN